MKNQDSKLSKPRARSGQASPTLIGALVLLVIGGGVLAYVLLSRPTTGPVQTTPDPPTLSEEEIDKELTKLKQAFETALNEKQKNLDDIQGESLLFVQRFPENASGQVLYAQVLIAQKAWESAYQAWLAALALDESAFELHKMAGFTAAKLGRLEQAVTHYQGAVAASGKRADSQVYNALGQLFISMADPDAAEQAFTQAITAPAPGDKTNWQHEAHSGLADVAVLRGQYDKAIETINTAMDYAELDSGADFVGYEIQRARILMDAGRDRDAALALTNTGITHPSATTRIESVRLRARLHEKNDRLEAAVNHVQAMCETYQLDVNREKEKLADLYALLANWQIKAGRMDAARLSIDNVATLVATHPGLEQLRAKLNN